MIQFIWFAIQIYVECFLLLIIASIGIRLILETLILFVKGFSYENSKKISKKN